MRTAFTRRRKSQRGFSLLEMMFATIILLVGLVAIAQLVPASILLNYSNRMDSSALVFAQHELDQMLDQPITATLFTDVLGNPCLLGNPAVPNTVQGTNVLLYSNPFNPYDKRAVIDFTSSVPGYTFTSPDPTDPSGTIYDVRWAVIVTANAGIPSSKRFILGVRQVGGKGYFQPITLDTMVAR